MCNNTLEDAYKIAVKKKYDDEKGGKYFIYLSKPTRAKLRKLCWELFESKNMHQNDLNVFTVLLGLPFDITQKNKFKGTNDKFRPIETFFKGETDPLNIDAVDLAAVLVDFQPRPFSKFRLNPVIDNVEEVQEGKVQREIDEEEIGGNSKLPSENKNLDILENKPKNKKKPFERLFEKSKPVMLVTAVIFCLTAAVIYFGFIKKRCMQWSDNHYEIVNCDKPIEGNLNDVIQRDDNLINFRKIEVYDTTICFKPNRESIVWYSKTDNKVDFFNTDGKHPISKKPLKPVTQHIIDKYGTKTSKK